MKSNFVRTIIAGLLGTALVLSGCSSSTSDKVQVNDSIAEVSDINTITPVDWHDDLYITVNEVKIELPCTVQTFLDAGLTLQEELGVAEPLSGINDFNFINLDCTIDTGKSVFNLTCCNPTDEYISATDMIVTQCTIFLDMNGHSPSNLSVGSLDFYMTYDNIIELYGEPAYVEEYDDNNNFSLRYYDEGKYSELYFLAYTDENDVYEGINTINLCGDIKPKEITSDYYSLIKNNLWNNSTVNWKDDLFIEVNGTKITLPATLQDFYDAGLKLGTYGASECTLVSPGYSYIGYLNVADSVMSVLQSSDEAISDYTYISVWYYNPNDIDTPIEDCLIYRIAYIDTSYNRELFKLGSLNTAMTVEDIVELYGRPDTEHDVTSNYYELIYGDESAIYTDGGKGQGIRIDVDYHSNPSYPVYIIYMQCY
jgi:hypothetical protein